MSEHQEPNALRAAEPWLRSKAESIFRALTPDGAGYDDEGRDRAVERILFQLKVAYCEGYSDRLKDEVKEMKSPEPKKRVTRRKK